MSSVDREIDLKAIAGFAVGLVVVLAASAVFVWYFSKLLRGYEEASDPPPPALAAAREPYLPPGPRLQVDPVQEMRDLRAHENGVLDSYGWVDEAAGIARIPIARAIDLAVGEAAAGMPADPDPGPEAVH
ncbi:MAG: hypothetical protein OES32_10235 [Acidobacteriota bacterium]|nr:hypothetical protein [Acidobacteriota bacterium]MDH3523952.1 hypothetical protein [Acidobacteriota bacterium]